MVIRSNDFIRVIGKISVAFATWDLLTSLLIVRLVAPERQIPKLERMTLGWKLRHLEGLSREDVISPDLLDRIQSALPSAIPVSAMRNRFIHDHWVFAPELIARGEIDLAALVVLEVPDGRGITLATKRFHLDDLRAFHADVIEQLRRFSVFANEVSPQRLDLATAENASPEATSLNDEIGE